uniref:Uncharacterized protein n=1 Tax=Anguilla anguilla TaxID=7936 RepID=A0A0E9VMZ2_ANGAN
MGKCQLCWSETSKDT